MQHGRPTCRSRNAHGHLKRKFIVGSPRAPPPTAPSGSHIQATQRLNHKESPLQSRPGGNQEMETKGTTTTQPQTKKSTAGGAKSQSGGALRPRFPSATRPSAPPNNRRKTATLPQLPREKTIRLTDACPKHAHLPGHRHNMFIDEESPKRSERYSKRLQPQPRLLSKCWGYRLLCADGAALAQCQNQEACGYETQFQAPCVALNKLFS